MALHQSSHRARWLYRGRLRDVVVVLCVLSVFFHRGDVSRTCVASALLAAGCALHVLVKGQLIRNVTLCTTGAYAIVRHPYYLANYLIDTSFCLFSGNIYLVLLYPFLFFWAYDRTLREEEDLLAELHAEAFDAFRVRSPQVFPTPVSLAGFRSMASAFSWRRVSWGELKRICRFGFIGSLLLLLQSVGIGSVIEFTKGHNPVALKDVALLVICILFLMATAVLPGRRDRAVGSEAQKDGR
jgi:protein-S-isoprenylcysteine O-methyltransferase Ste14